MNWGSPFNVVTHDFFLVNNITSHTLFPHYPSSVISHDFLEDLSIDLHFIICHFIIIMSCDSDLHAKLIHPILITKNLMLGSVPIPSYIPFFKSKETIGKQIMKMMNVQLAKTQTEKRKQVVDNKDLHAPLFHAPPSSLSDLVAQIQLMQTTLATHGQLLQSLLDAQYKISTNVYDLKGSFSRFTRG